MLSSSLHVLRAFAFRDELNAHVRLFASCSRSSRLKLRPDNEQPCAQLIYRSILKRKPRMRIANELIDVLSNRVLFFYFEHLFFVIVLFSDLLIVSICWKRERSNCVDVSYFCQNVFENL